MKKLVSLLLVCIMLVALSASAFASGDVQELTFAHVLDEEHPVHLGAVYFAERLEELSGGTMKTTVYPNSALGDEDEIAEMQSYSDTITFSAPSGNSLQDYAPAMYAADFYFQFENYDQVWAFYDGEYGDYIKDSLDGTGLVVTSFWDNGFRTLTTTNKEVHTADDLKGMKVRVMNAETHLAFWNAIGCAATPVPYAEVYSALQQGVAEAEENPVFNILGSRFNEVQKYLITTNHVHDVSPLIVSGTAWEKWTDEQRAWVQQASDEAAAYMRQCAIDLVDEKTQVLIDSGMELIELTEAERQTFVDAVKDVPAQFADRMGDDVFALYEKCIAEAQQVG